MGNFVSAAKAARKVVEVSVGGLDWRVRPPTPMQVLEAGAKAVPRIAADEPEPEGTPSASTVQDRLAQVGLAYQGARDLQALVCAAVVEVRAPGQGWEPVTLVLDEAEEDGREEAMWVGTLPPASQIELLTAALAAQGGALARVIATFHGEPG